MKSNSIYTLILFAVLVSNGFSQNTVAQDTGRLYDKEVMSGREMLAYPDLLERDVSWQKRVFRRIDVREKMNLRFIDQKLNRMFLNVLIEYIEDGNKFYGVSTKESALSDEIYAIPFTIPAQFGKEDITMKKNAGYTISFSDTTSSVVSNTDRSMTHQDWVPTDVVYYEIVEDWYVDDRYGKMQVRIAGIRPQLEFVLFDRSTGNDVVNILSYWIPYSGLRPYLANTAAPNYENGVETISWDDVFQFRLFNSYIAKDDLTPQDQYLEDMYPNSSFRKKIAQDELFEELFELEQSLWSY